MADQVKESMLGPSVILSTPSFTSAPSESPATRAFSVAGTRSVPASPSKRMPSDSFSQSRPDSPPLSTNSESEGDGLERQLPTLSDPRIFELPRRHVPQDRAPSPDVVGLEDYSFDLRALADSYQADAPPMLPQRAHVSSDDDGPEDFTVNLEAWMRGNGPGRKSRRTTSSAGSSSSSHKDKLSTLASTPPQRHATESSITSQQRKASIPDFPSRDGEGNATAAKPESPGLHERPLISEVSLPHRYRKSGSQDEKPLAAGGPQRHRSEKNLAPQTQEHLEKNASSKQGVVEEGAADSQGMAMQLAEDVFEQIAALQTESTRLRTQDEHHVKQVERLQGENADLRRRLQLRQSESQDKTIALLKKDIQEVAQMAGQAHNSLALPNSQLETLHANIRAVSSDSGSLVRKMAECLENNDGQRTHETGQTKELLAQMERQNRELVSEIQRLMGEAVESKDQMHQKTAELQTTLLAIAELRKDQQEMERQHHSQLKTIQERLNKTKIQVKNNEASLRRTHQDQIAQLNAEIVFLRGDPSRHSEDHYPEARALDDEDHKVMDHKQTTTARANRPSEQPVQRDPDPSHKLFEHLSARLSLVEKELVQKRTHMTDPATEGMRQKIEQAQIERDQALRDLQRMGLELRRNPQSPEVKALQQDLAKAREEVQQAQEMAQQAKCEAALMVQQLEQRLPPKYDEIEPDWCRKIEMLVEERDRMANALMHAWGREEVGPAKEGERQAYRYKYVKGRF